LFFASCFLFFHLSFPALSTGPASQFSLYFLLLLSAAFFNLDVNLDDLFFIDFKSGQLFDGFENRSVSKCNVPFSKHIKKRGQG